MSKNETVDRTRGPELELSTTIGKGDTALVIGLISASGSDSADTEAIPDAEPTLVIGDGLLDDAQASEISTALAVLGASGSHGEVTRIAAPASLPVDLVVAVGLGGADNVDDPDQLRQAAGIAAVSYTHLTLPTSELV